MSRLFTTFLTFAVVLAAYKAYELAIPLWLPQGALAAAGGLSTAKERERARGRISRYDVRFASLFPYGAWERQGPKVVETEYGMLLFRDYETSENKLTLSPCTLIFQQTEGVASNRSRETDEPPLIVRVSDRAELSFDGKIDLARGEVGPLTGGRLVGEITINRRETEPGAADDLAIRTRHLFMDAARAWTSSEVEFRYGQSRGSGKDLILTFLTKDDGRRAPTAASIIGVKSLELVRVERIHIQTSGGEMLPGAKAETGPKPENREPAGATLEITCGGPLVIDVPEQLATFSRQVNVHHAQRDGPADSLSCETLELHLQWGKALPRQIAEKARRGSRTASASETGDLEEKDRTRGLKKLAAYGAPVIVRSPSAGAIAEGSALIYDAAARRVKFSADDRVTITVESSRLEAAAVEYEIVEGGGLGRAWAAGPVLFTHQPPTSLDQRGALRPSEPFRVSCQKELTLQPDGDAHVLSLLGAASVSGGPTGRAAAEKLHLWFKEARDIAKGARRSPNSSTHAGGLELNGAWRPRRLLAVGAVEIASPKLQAKTQTLDLRIADLPPSPSGRGAGGAGFGGDERAANPLEALTEEATGPPIEVRAAEVSLSVARRGDETELTAADLTGAAAIAIPGDASASSAAAASTITVSGGRLSLRRDADHHEIFTVAGRPGQTPARLANESFDLTAAAIHLDRTGSRVWINGPGQVRADLAANAERGKGGAAPPRNSPNESATGSAPKPNPLGPFSINRFELTWAKGLTFDGQRLDVTGDLRGVGDGQRFHAEQLTVTLANRLDFANPRGGKPVIEEVALDGGVLFYNESKEGPRLVARDRGRARRFRYRPISGDFEMLGPGFLETVRRGSVTGLDTRRPEKPSATVRPAAAHADAEETPLTHIRVDFQTAGRGNTETKDVVLSDHVQTLYGPTAGWPSPDSYARPPAPLPASRTQLKKDEILLTCRELELADMAPAGAPAALEMVARGDTVIEHREFTAKAARLAYSQAKDVVTLEGDGRAPARLWRHNQGDGVASEAAAGKIMYYRTAGRVEVSDARFLDLSDFGVEQTR